MVPKEIMGGRIDAQPSIYRDTDLHQMPELEYRELSTLKGRIYADVHY
jgi:hypothetical protein